jgi:AraC-like DNA-binding protein
MHQLFSIPMHELTDNDYEAHAVLGAFGWRLQQLLGNCRTLEGRVRIADEFMLQRSLRALSSHNIPATTRQIFLSPGQARIAMLADYADLSMRQLERDFITQVGMPPKLHARIARFEAALDRKARSSSKSWTDVAHEFGYYDQMHMVHDFKYLSGESPAKTLRQFEALFRAPIDALRSRGLSASRAEDRLIF